MYIYHSILHVYCITCNHLLQPSHLSIVLSLLSFVSFSSVQPATYRIRSSTETVPLLNESSPQ